MKQLLISFLFFYNYDCSFSKLRWNYKKRHRGWLGFF